MIKRTPKITKQNGYHGTTVKTVDYTKPIRLEMIIEGKACACMRARIRRNATKRFPDIPDRSELAHAQIHPSL